MPESDANGKTSGVTEPMSTQSPSTLSIGRALSALVVLVLLADATVHLLLPEKLAANMAAGGFELSQTSTLGIIALTCAVLYAVPSTAILGAVLMTGFLGGAICTHFRMGEMLSPPPLICIALGVLAWGGLYLRDTRLRTLLPLRA